MVRQRAAIAHITTLALPNFMGLEPMAMAEGGGGGKLWLEASVCYATVAVQEFQTHGQRNKQHARKSGLTPNPDRHRPEPPFA